jgi:metal-responsive CopG/Arc/MetJ family transcriptional regulator
MKKMGRPRTETEALTLRLSQDMLKKIDDARREEDDLPTRPEMIRRVLEAWVNQKSLS